MQFLFKLLVVAVNQGQLPLQFSYSVFLLSLGPGDFIELITQNFVFLFKTQV